MPFSLTTSGRQWPQIHGHRGCRGLFPENTIPGFLHAVALGVDVLELDVVISADRQVVVSHEPWLSARLGTDPKGQIIDPQHERDFNLYHLPYATIRQCLVGNQPHPGFPEQQQTASYRPLLSEVLLAADSACHSLGRPLVGYSVELKSSTAGDELFHPLPTVFVELVLAELRASSALARTTLLSFDYRILQAAHKVADCPTLCLLNEEDTSAEVLFTQLGFVPSVFGPYFETLSPATIHGLRMHFPNLQLVPWTVNKLADLERMLEWPLLGITTDYPDRLHSLLVGRK